MHENVIKCVKSWRNYLEGRRNNHKTINFSYHLNDLIAENGVGFSPGPLLSHCSLMFHVRRAGCSRAGPLAEKPLLHP